MARAAAPRTPPAGVVKPDGATRVRERGGLFVTLGVSAAALAIVWLLASRTGSDAPFAPVEPIAAIAFGFLPALLWLGFAGGLAVPASKLLPAHLVGAERSLAALALGVGSAMWLDALLARLGLLTAASGTLAWLLIAASALLIAPLRQVSIAAPRLSWRDLAFATPIATLVVAAIAAPGWLWSSEFGGYDALSYHLQLPKEWLASGRLAPLTHNVYSHLPSHVEASTLHLMAILRDPLDAAIPAQCLQAILAITTAGLLAATTQRLAGGDKATRSGFVAAAVFIGTPWIVVTGSLAYQEMAVCLGLSAGLAVVLQGRETPSPSEGRWSPRPTIAVAILAACATGAKATAIGFVALPLGLLLLASMPRRRWIPAIAIGVATGLAVLSPWLVHNAISTGQPFFPLLANHFGGGEWNAEQIAIFGAAHAPDTSPWRAFLDEALLHGIGGAATSLETTRPQWSLLWLIGLAAIGWIAARGARRAIGWRLATTIVAMLLFWASLTHLESRFLVPAAVPLAMAVGLAAADLRRPIEHALVALAAFAWSTLPAAVFLRERPASEGDRWGSPAAATGRVATLSGDLHIRLLRDPGIPRPERAAVLESAPPWTFINDPALTGADGRVLLVGEARPFYLRRDGEYATVWDRGRLSRLVREHPGDPRRWRRELAESGFTLLLIDRNMIDRWRRDGWWDPGLDADSIEALLETLVPLRRFAYGLELFAIREPSSP